MIQIQMVNKGAPAPKKSIKKIIEEVHEEYMFEVITPNIVAEVTAKIDFEIMRDYPLASKAPWVVKITLVGQNLSIDLSKEFIDLMKMYYPEALL